MPRKNPHAVALGRKGGRAKSPAKTAAARRNIAARWAKRTPRCETCQREMTRTASAPVGDSPMVWRCFHCIETGTVSAQGQEVIVVDEDGHVSVEPINEG